MVEKETKEIKKQITSIDINAIVKKAQESYQKKDFGLSRQISTGKSIARPVEDKDFVVWTRNDFWKSLTGLKGLPFGKICQVAGKPDSGKSSCAGNFMKMAQDQGTVVILWDSEQKFSPLRFDSKMGGKSDQLLVVNNNGIVEGCKAVSFLVHAVKELNPNAKILIVWDSVGACVNSSEDKNDEENFSQQPGISAKENSFAIKKFNKLASRYMNKETGEQSIATLVINQVYQTIGFGISVAVEKGGQEITYLSSLIIQLSRKKDLLKVKGGKKFKYGIVTRAKVKKNHLFDGDDCIAEMDLAVSADGVQLADDVKKDSDIKGWEDDEEGDE